MSALAPPPQQATSRMALVDRLARWRVPAGFACGLAVLAVARPTPRSLAIGAAIALLGEAIRIWAAGHLEKGREVTMSGPYRYVRHPLYLGSTVMAVGLAVAVRHPLAWVIALLYVLIMMGSAIRSEEAFLRRQFGPTYDDYRAGRLAGARRRFSLERARRNREWRAVLGLLVVLAVLAWRARLG